jgi:uncharacterized protein YndB with AHSA1/START domain
MRSDATPAPTVTIKRVIAGTAEDIFDLWTHPKLMVRWMSPYAGTVHSEAAADVRVGGAFKLSMVSGDSVCDIHGTYVEVERPTKLVFTWRGPPTANVNTLVTLALKALETGTELTLTHEKLPTPEVREGHRTGWSNMFDHLVAELG